MRSKPSSHRLAREHRRVEQPVRSIVELVIGLAGLDDGVVDGVGIEATSIELLGIRPGLEQLSAREPGHDHGNAQLAARVVAKV